MTHSGLIIRVLGATSVLVTSATAFAKGHAQTPACAAASLHDAVKDPKGAAVLREKCKRELAAQRAADARRPPAPPPARPAPRPRADRRPQRSAAAVPPPRRHNSLFGLLGLRTSSAPPPRQPPAQSNTVRFSLFAPSPAPAPAAAPAPAPSAPARPPEPAATNVAPPGGAGASASGALVVGSPDPSLINDRLRAEHAQVDLGVFALRLGEPLSVPLCPADAARDAAAPATGVPSQTTATTCRFAPSAFGGSSKELAERIAGAPEQLPKGLEYSLVSLAASQCPDWVSAGGGCVLSVATKNGYTLGVSLIVGAGSLQARIEQSISDKYGRKPKARELGAPCSAAGSPAAPLYDRRWEAPGLSVSYQPAGGLGCEHGRVAVETDTLHHLLPATPRSSRPAPRAQPKM